MSKKQTYNPYEDKDIKTPVYRENGKALVLPAHIVGVKPKRITTKRGDECQVIDFLYEVSSQVEKVDDLPIYPEDENGDYQYNKTPEEYKPATLLEEKKYRSGNGATMWRNLSKGSGGMNRNYIKDCKALGVEVEQEETEYDGKKIKVDVIPEPTEENFLGLPVFIFLSEEQWRDNGNNLRKSTKVGKVVANENGKKRKITKNELQDDGLSGGTNNSADDDPFDDEIPF